jgi:hypothetical protein
MKLSFYRNGLIGDLRVEGRGLMHRSHPLAARIAGASGWALLSGDEAGGGASH